MSNELDPGKITQLLNQGTRQMGGQVLSALCRVRQKALERHSAYTPAFILAPNGVAHAYADRWMGWTIPRPMQQMVIAGLLATVVISGLGYWHHAEEQRIGELDVAILTDELPIEVFVDH